MNTVKHLSLGKLDLLMRLKSLQKMKMMVNWKRWANHQALFLLPQVKTSNQLGKLLLAANQQLSEKANNYPSNNQKQFCPQQSQLNLTLCCRLKHSKDSSHHDMTNRQTSKRKIPISLMTSSEDQTSSTRRKKRKRELICKWRRATTTWMKIWAILTTRSQVKLKREEIVRAVPSLLLEMLHPTHYPTLLHLTAEGSNPAIKARNNKVIMNMQRT